MSKRNKMGSLANAAGSAFGEVTPEALASLLVPSMDELAKRVHGVLDHAEDAVRGAASDAEVRSRRAMADAEGRARRVVGRAGDELRDAGRDMNVKVAERIRDAKHGAESLLDSFMDRVLALGLAIAIGYGTFVLTKARGGSAEPAHLAVLTWSGMTFLSIVLGVAWGVAGRPERLKHTLTWFLYIVALGGLGTLVLMTISRLPPL